jgi:hypothetical protein
MKQSITAAIAAVVLIGGTALAAQQQAPPATPKPTAPPAAAPAPASPAGKWNMNLESPNGAMAVALEVKVDAANKVTGTLEGPQGPTAIAGEVKDGVLGFSISFDAGGTAMEIYFEGKINPEGKMAGTVSLGDMGTFPFTAERVKGL